MRSDGVLSADDVVCRGMNPLGSDCESPLGTGLVLFQEGCGPKYGNTRTTAIAEDKIRKG